jgi:hypothetical protein
VRYDSPTWGGFRFETSYGKNQLTGPLQPALNPYLTSLSPTIEFLDTSDTDFWDIAVFYTGDWNSIKLSAAAAYTWIETAVRPSLGNLLNNATSTLTDGNLFQIGASIMHKPSGLGIYGLYQHEETGGRNTLFFTSPNVTASIANPDTDVWYVKPFWRKAWSPIGATVLFAEYGQYEDQFGAAEFNLCTLGFSPTTTTGGFCFNTVGAANAYVTGSEVQRWGLGVVQEIDSAAMHLWLRWQHQEFDKLSAVGFDSAVGSVCEFGCTFNQGFDDFDVFQAGGIIFF